jgi:hypothetical protein
MAIGPKTMRLSRRLRVTVGRHADQTTRDLTVAWARAWAELDTAMRAGVVDAVDVWAATGRWPQPWELVRIQRLRDALWAAQLSLGRLGQRTGVLVTDGAGHIIHATAEAEPHLIASQLPAGEQGEAAKRFTGRTQPTALDAIVARTGGQITSTLLPLSAAATEAMRRELIRGIAEGTNPNDAARQMVRRVQGAFNGGLTRAMTIARTEMLDAYRTTSRYVHNANADVVESWVWHCFFSNRTCLTCISMNGTVHPVEDPGPLDHPRGRCVRVPRTRTWRELGINLNEPPHTLPDARAWFARLPEDDQVAIMGAGRLDLLRSGRVTWDDLAQRRTNTGWRDSYGPTPVAELRRRAALAGAAA